MSILVRFAPTSMTTEQYEAVKRAVVGESDAPPDGAELHVCFGEEGRLRVSEVWASREQFDAFAQRLMPAIEAAGIEMSTPPEFFEVHNMMISRTEAAA